MADWWGDRRGKGAGKQKGYGGNGYGGGNGYNGGNGYGGYGYQQQAGGAADWGGMDAQGFVQKGSYGGNAFFKGGGKGKSQVGDLAAALDQIEAAVRTQQRLNELQGYFGGGGVVGPGVVQGSSLLEQALGVPPQTNAHIGVGHTTPTATDAGALVTGYGVLAGMLKEVAVPALRAVLAGGSSRPAATGSATSGDASEGPLSFFGRLKALLSPGKAAEAPEDDMANTVRKLQEEVKYLRDQRDGDGGGKKARRRSRTPTRSKVRESTADHDSLRDMFQELVHAMAADGAAGRADARGRRDGREDKPEEVVVDDDEEQDDGDGMPAEVQPDTHTAFFAHLDISSTLKSAEDFDSWVTRAEKRTTSSEWTKLMERGGGTGLDSREAMVRWLFKKWWRSTGSRAPSAPTRKARASDSQSVAKA